MMKRIFVIALFALLYNSCGIYTFTGADTSGAETFSVDYFKPQTPLATPLLAQNFTEALKDLVLQQSTLNLSGGDGDLHFEGSIVEYSNNPISVQSDEVASLNRLQISIKVKYVNQIEDEKSFERTFTKFSDYESSLDFLSVEEELNTEIIDQLTQEIFNASLGNW
jgi:hypothetical protein